MEVTLSVQDDGESDEAGTAGVVGGEEGIVEDEVSESEDVDSSKGEEGANVMSLPSSPGVGVDVERERVAETELGGEAEAGVDVDEEEEETDGVAEDEGRDGEREGEAGSEGAGAGAGADADVVAFTSMAA